MSVKLEGTGHQYWNIKAVPNTEGDRRLSWSIAYWDPKKGSRMVSQYRRVSVETLVVKLTSGNVSIQPFSVHDDHSMHDGCFIVIGLQG